jgi:diguanylate cyclase (GGDEF)-like protein
MRRKLRLLVSAAVVFAFWEVSPGLLHLDEQQLALWWTVGWILAPLLAALLSLRAMHVSQGPDKHAWCDLAIMCVLWAAGSLLWSTIDHQSSPGYADVSYLAGSLFVLSAFLRYSLGGRIAQEQASKFALVLTAACLCVYLVFFDALRSSDLTLPGLWAAVLYPVTALCTLAFAMLSAVYAPGHKAFVFSLLIASCASQAGAAFPYARDLLIGEYTLGAPYEGLWLLTFLLIAAAAHHHRHSVVSAAATPRRDLPTAVAFLPAILLAAVFGSLLFSGSLGHGPPAWAGAALMILFSAALGFRQRVALSEASSLRADTIRAQHALRSALASTTDGVVVIDRDWSISFVNERAQSFFPGLPSFRPGGNLWEVFPEAVDSRFRREYEHAFDTQKPVEFEELLSDSDLWLEVHVYPSGDTLTIFFRDITDKKNVREQIDYLASHDPLTGLINRRVFWELLDARLQTAGVPPAAVLWIDLDRFKEVNDTKGHAAGDALLKCVAERLVDCASEHDVVARIGGDEFAILRPDGGVQEEVAKFAQTLLRRIAKPVRVDQSVLTTTGSLGIAISGLDGASADELFKKADIALYAVKEAGRGAFRFFEPRMQEEFNARQVMKLELKTALYTSQLALAYQPIVDLKTLDIVGCEALMRWQHPSRGFISPQEFIPAAEDAGLIKKLGDWALNDACSTAARHWPPEVRVAVNVSAHEFADKGFLKRVRLALAESGLAPHRLELEVTESVMLHDTRSNLKILGSLRELGVNIALDDFGTGYSSLAYLRRFPFTKIKIDRSFVKDAAANSEAQAIIQTIINLGRTLNMTVTAEGIETVEQMRFLREAGCHEAQGYFFARPQVSKTPPTVALHRGLGPSLVA